MTIPASIRRRRARRRLAVLSRLAAAAGRLGLFPLFLLLLAAAVPV